MNFLHLRQAPQQDLSPPFSLKGTPASRGKWKTVLKNKQLIQEAENFQSLSIIDLQSPPITQVLASVRKIEDGCNKCKPSVLKKTKVDSFQLGLQPRASDACHSDSESWDDVGNLSSLPAQASPVISTSPSPASSPSPRMFPSTFLARFISQASNSSEKSSVERTRSSDVPSGKKGMTSTELVDVVPPTPNSISTFVTPLSVHQPTFTPPGSPRHGFGNYGVLCPDQCECVRCSSGKCGESKFSRTISEHSRTQSSALNLNKREDLSSGNRISFLMSSTQSLPIKAEPVGIRPRPAPKKFEPKRLSSVSDVDAARKCLVTDESGRQLRFGELIEHEGPTVVVFIRQFWCTFCQAYVSHLSSHFNKSGSTRRLKSMDMKVVFIGNGSHTMIKAYRELTNSMFPIYTDETAQKHLYRALGMTLRTLDGGLDKNRGSYLSKVSSHRNFLGSPNGLKMPGNPGHLRQLGGEFVFTGFSGIATAHQLTPRHSRSSSLEKSPTNSELSSLSTAYSRPDSPSKAIQASLVIGMSYANRMTTTRDHGSVPALFKAAGIEVELMDASRMYEPIG